MTDTVSGLIGIAALLALILFRIPVAFAMFAVGFAGITALSGLPVAMGLLASETFTLGSKFELIVIPLFILMGNLATRTGMSRALYTAAYALVGQWRGGLAHATLLGCGAFSALCGSSVASALTMPASARVALIDTAVPRKAAKAIPAVLTGLGMSPIYCWAGFSPAINF